MLGSTQQKSPLHSASYMKEVHVYTYCTHVERLLCVVHACTCMYMYNYTENVHMCINNYVTGVPKPYTIVSSLNSCIASSLSLRYSNSTLIIIV